MDMSLAAPRGSREYLNGALRWAEAETASQSDTVREAESSPEAAAQAHDTAQSTRDEDEPGSAVRVALFTPAPSYGGAQRVTITVANSLAERGYDVDLVAGTLDGEFRSNISEAVQTVDLGVPRVPGVGILAGIPHLRSYLQSARPDVLFASRTHTNIAAATAASLSGVDVHVALTEHITYGGVDGVDDRSGLKDRVMYTVAPVVYRLADDVVAVSEGVAESIVENTGLDADDTTVLYNPIDVEDVRQNAGGTVDHDWLTDPELQCVVSVSRLEPQKDLSTLVEAFATVNETHPETRLICVGKGSERDSLEALARSLGVEEHVSFPGYVDNPYVYMRESDVFVLSSRYEGLPTTLIEALACGSTVVATDCPVGPREILADGEYGWLTPVGDADRIAEAVEEALESPVPPEQSVERAEYFSVPKSTDRYEQYIHDVLEGSTSE